MDKSVNEIYEDRVVKFTLNLPLDMYAKISKKAHAKYRRKNAKGIWIREMLDKILVDERPVSMAELMRIEKEGTVYGYHRKYEDPPKRYHGFVDSLLRNIFLCAWWQKKRLDRISAQR